MGDRRCCCEIDCHLAEDDFNDREDGDVPEDDPKWKVIAGDWEFDNGVLINTEPGIIATRVTHPAKWDLGSFRARFRMMALDGENAKIHHVRCGHPVNATHEVEIEPIDYGTEDAKTKVTLRSESKEVVTHIPELPNEVITEVYWAPGHELSLYFPGYAPEVAITICPGSSNSSPGKHTIDEEEVGNFSFLEGDFDDWEYVVHWLDEPDLDEQQFFENFCPFLACFCYLRENGDESFRCIPDTLYITLTSRFTEPPGRTCFPPEGTYAMHQVRFEPVPDVPNSGWVMKKEWLSETIEVYESEPFDHLLVAAFRYRLECVLNLATGTPVGEWKLNVEVVSMQLLPFTDTPVDESPANTLIQSPAIEATCEPLYIRFLDGVGVEYEPSGHAGTVCQNEGWDFDDPQPRVIIEVTE